MTAVNNLDAWWMPFTANRAFKSAPRLLVSAQGMYYRSADGREILDGTAGLWCVNAGHGRKEIVAAVQEQVATLDFAPSFQMGHPKGFEAAAKLANILPGDMNHVFFANSGSEAVDTALKIALAYHRIRGEGSRTRFIGRERGYHGVGFGGISVGGISPNRKLFGAMLPGTDHIGHTLDIGRNAFSKGLPEFGVERAEELERVILLHDPSNVAAVIVEPVAGSTGVILPPKGYLERLRAICDKYGVLLIFDEVITGFGRLGTPFGMDYFNVLPDLMTCAKGLTNATVPMAAVGVRQGIYDAFMQGAPAGAIEFFHGYTYSGHPVAAAAAVATLDLYARDNLLTRAAELAPYWEQAIHSLRGLPNVIDIRNIGLIGAVEVEPLPGKPGARAFDIFLRAFEGGALVRQTNDIIALSPPLIIEKGQIDRLVEILGAAIKANAAA